MKSLQEFIQEQKNLTQGIKVGDKLYCVISSETSSSDMKPFEVTILDKSENKNTNNGYEWYDVSKNDHNINSILINVKDEELLYFYTFAMGEYLVEVFIGKSIEDLEELLNGQYCDQIKDLTDQINKTQETLNKLNNQLNNIIKKSTLNK